MAPGGLSMMLVAESDKKYSPRLQILLTSFGRADEVIE